MLMARRYALAALSLLLLQAPLAAQTPATTLSTGRAQDVGMSQAVLDGAVGLYRETVARDDLVGVVLLVARNGTIVLHEAVGLRNREPRLPMEKNTLFKMASNTKPVVATGAAILVERNKLRYDDLVRKHIPSFDNYKSGFITVGHLLSHTSGFRITTLFLPDMVPGTTLQREVTRFGTAGASVEPGTSYSYNNPGFNTVGALIEIASAQPLDVFLREEIYRKLGMHDTYHLEVADKLDGKLNRMGAVYYRRTNGQWTPGWKPGDAADVPFVRASGGLISTAPDYAIFLQTFLNGGSYGGVTLIRPETVRMMTSRRTPAGESPYGYGWVVGEDGVYSHTGSDGTFAWVDPARGIIGMVLTQTPGGRNPRQRFVELVNLSLETT